MGMTEMQYKSFLRQLISNLEAAIEEDEKEAITEKIEEILKTLHTDLES